MIRVITLFILTNLVISQVASFKEAVDKLLKKKQTEQKMKASWFLSWFRVLKFQ